MDNWPTAPLIIITEGASKGVNVAGSAAVLVDIYNSSRGYYLLTGPLQGGVITPSALGDNIFTWKTAIPVALTGLYD